MDPIWRLDVYKLALFAGDIGWQDVLKLSTEKLMYSIADQLHRSLNSISANLTEGYSRSKGLDRARFIEYALGSPVKVAIGITNPAMFYLLTSPTTG